MTMTVSGFNTQNTDPDTDLICKMAQGNQNALAHLMARHIQSIKSLTWHMVGDEMQAEDITQEVFLKAWIQAPSWQFGNAKFSTWLYRVAKNLCLDHLRKARELYSDDPPEMIDTRPLASTVLETSEQDQLRKRAVQAALETLPARQKLAITLCHFQNLSQKQAAEIMAINVRAYESLLSRGRKNLHTGLKKTWHTTQKRTKTICLTALRTCYEEHNDPE